MPKFILKPKKVKVDFKIMMAKYNLDDQNDDADQDDDNNDNSNRIDSDDDDISSSDNSSDHDVEIEDDYNERREVLEQCKNV